MHFQSAWLIVRPRPFNCSASSWRTDDRVARFSNVSVLGSLAALSLTRACLTISTAPRSSDALASVTQTSTSIPSSDKHHHYHGLPRPSTPTHRRVPPVPCRRPRNTRPQRKSHLAQRRQFQHQAREWHASPPSRRKGHESDWS
ncbi:hypothetical protein IG631_07560 [Alternaria alternata]|nr:hypothetical protein IG631_07560 [Alternaria alternata]